MKIKLLLRNYKYAFNKKKVIKIYFNCNYCDITINARFNKMLSYGNILTYNPRIA